MLTGNKYYTSLMACIIALAGLLFGYDAGIISGSLLFIKQTFPLSETQVGVIVSAVPFGALIMAALAGRFCDWWGRKKMLLMTALLFLLGALMAALAQNIGQLILGRLLEGFAVGMGSFSAPLYIAEISPEQHRGRLVTLNQLAITIGILLSYIINFIFAASEQWRMMIGLGMLPALILGILVLIIPESPRWLFSKGQQQKALNIMQFIHGQAQAEREIKLLNEVIHLEQLKLRQILNSSFIRVLLLGIVVSILTQAVGINAIIYYAPTIFTLTGFGKATSAILATVGIGAINVIFTIVAAMLLDQLGRRKLLLTGVSGIIISLIILTAGFSYGVQGSLLLAWIVFISMLAFIACQAIGTGPACWLIPSEIFPTQMRGVGMGFSVAFNWGTNVVVAFLFPIILQAWGGAVSFGIFLVIAIIALIAFSLYVPETKNVSLEKIEKNLLSGLPTRELGNP